MPINIFLRSFGCSLNIADGEVMAGCLSQKGYNIVNKLEDADVVIYNTCAVKASTENRMISLMKTVPPRKKLIVAGCLPLINLQRVKKEVNFDGIIGPAPGEGIVPIVEAVLRGEKPIVLRRDSKPKLSLPRIRTSPIISIIPIAYGCLGSCSYCCVRLARGKLRSYRIEEVVQETKRSLSEGALEIWLTAQDCACYGEDTGESLSSLIREICKIKGYFKIRVGMMSPDRALLQARELVEVYKDEHVFKFLHVPVQSGNDNVLKLMRRNYTVEEFKRLIKIFRELGRITIATDVICGFPGESDEAFEDTVRLIEEIKPDITNISMFGARPGTPAKEMKQLPSSIIKERSKRMTEVAERVSLERNKEWIEWRGEVLIDEKGNKPGTWIGRNFAYKPIVVESMENLLGKRLEVKVIEAYPYYLKAEIVTVN